MNTPAREVATISPRKFSVVRGTQGVRHLLALVRGQFERNEMLPRKLDRTGTNAHTSIGVHREPDCADQRLANHLPVVAKDVESFDAVDPERGKVDSITGTIKTFPNV